MTEPDRDDFSFARLAVLSLGAAALVLGLSAVVVVLLEPGPVVGLVVVLIGVAGAIGAMGVVSTRMVRRGLGGDAQDDPPDEVRQPRPDPGPTAPDQ